MRPGDVMLHGPCPPSVIGTRIALHAGKRIGGGSASRGIEWLADAAMGEGWSVNWWPPECGLSFSRGPIYGPNRRQGWSGVVTLGAIVGTVVVARCVRDSGLPWAMPDQWHWVLEDVRKLAEPLPMRGHQGLWWAAMDAP